MAQRSCASSPSTGKYPITVITPGLNVEEILQMVRDLSPEYEQTIIVGYPPFLKTRLDEGVGARHALEAL